MAKCTVCDVALRAHLTDLQKHMNNQKHQANMENKAKHRSLQTLGVQVVRDETKRLDLKLAMFIAVHANICSMDHLCDLLKDVGKNTTLERLRLHRTKCSKIIKNVLAPALLSDLVDDMNTSGAYSFIIDESTDISVVKYLAIMVKYFSTKEGTMKTEFLGILEVYRATAEALTGALKEYASNLGLNLKEHLVGLGSDGANALIGRHNSVYSRLKEEIPQIQLIRCVCHSLHNAASEAAAEMPADLEFLVRETRNWFARSPLRRLQYRDLFGAINNGAMPANLVQLSATRWLAWSRAIDVVMSQWLELKTHFGIIAGSQKSSDKCTVGRKLSDLYRNEEHKLYLLFLQPITKALNQLNLKFQATDAEVPVLINELHEMCITVARMFLEPKVVPRLDAGGTCDTAVMSDDAIAALELALKNPQARLPLKSVDYGDPFRIELGRMQIKPDILNVIENRCVSYLASLLKGLLRILPEQSGRFSAMKHLMPGVCLKPYGQRPRFQSLPLSLAAKETDMTVLQQQWDRMANVDWGQYFDGSVPTSSVELWTALFKYEIGGERRFAAIAAFALRVLTTPLSNATVERAFSVMNLTKTKIRNRMQTKMLEALLRLRLWSHGRHCCAAFEPSAAMYALFNREMYDDDQVGGADGTEAGAADEMIDEIIVMISGDEEIL
ncbi:Zinc finger protein 862 [Frankliniella fusca]|uniref:Zinc finger protein 862 n=1 Tax=Frankliniella fusca TaxID=407009 RepID=A0AAE1LFH5_9NEOP|nr:Zinc finger protein 862 [Frankliniella fusca]KAK3917763.1 Zinc finger protein 862 [Frankliniella fusca]